MNTRTNKTVLLIILMICLATAVYSAVGTFTFRTSGASDTTEVVDLRYPQKVPEDSSVTTDSIADGSITNDKLAEPVSVANGGTGKTTAAEALAALGGASLNGSSTVDFLAQDLSASKAHILNAITQPVTGAVVPMQSIRQTFLREPAAGVTSIIASSTLNFGNYVAAHVYVVDVVSNLGAIFAVASANGPATTIEIIDPVAIYTPTKDNPGTINIYVENGSLTIQNNFTLAVYLSITVVGENAL